MNAAEHLAAGEQCLNYAGEVPSDDPAGADYQLQRAQAHFLAASAAAAIAQTPNPWEARR